MSRHPYLTESPDGDEIYVKCPYNEEWIGKFKDLVDRDSRKWDATAKHWIVDSAYADLVLDLIRDYYGEGIRRHQTAPGKAGAKARPKHGRAAEGANEERKQRYATAAPAEALSVDDYIARIAKEDASHVIRELTAKVGALTYELEGARRTMHSALDEVLVVKAANRRLDRTVADLTFKLTMAEARVNAPHVEDFLRNGGSSAAAYRTLSLAPDAPPALVEAARRTLARIYHPDVGGDAETMRKVNQAADSILKKD